ncbi:MAG: hypothetical protein ACI8TA_001778 [Cyclobacteriaceae bacterium]|jgi:hypothetical protein
MVNNERSSYYINVICKYSYFKQFINIATFLSVLFLLNCQTRELKSTLEESVEQSFSSILDSAKFSVLEYDSSYYWISSKLS